MTCTVRNSLPALAIVSLLTAGCSSSPEEAARKRLTGKWKAEMKMAGNVVKDDSGNAMTMDFEFKDDGKMSMDMFGIKAAGTWKVKSVDGDKVTIETILEMPSKIRGSGPDAGKTVETKTETKDFLVSFKSDNEATFHPVGDAKDPLTLKRE